jgi:hypothetical protein
LTKGVMPNEEKLSYLPVPFDLGETDGEVVLSSSRIAVFIISIHSVANTV